MRQRKLGGGISERCRYCQKYNKVIDSHSGGGSVLCGPGNSAGMDYCCLAFPKDGCLGLHARNEISLSWRSEHAIGFQKGDILPASQSVGYNRSTFRLPSPDLIPLAYISYTVRLCLKCALPPYVRPFPHHPRISLPSAQEERLYSHERSPAYGKIRNDMIYHINLPPPLPTLTL